MAPLAECAQSSPQPSIATASIQATESSSKVGDGLDAGRLRCVILSTKSSSCSPTREDRGDRGEHSVGRDHQLAEEQLGAAGLHAQLVARELELPGRAQVQARGAHQLEPARALERRRAHARARARARAPAESASRGPRLRPERRGRVRTGSARHAPVREPSVLGLDEGPPFGAEGRDAGPSSWTVAPVVGVALGRCLRDSSASPRQRRVFSNDVSRAQSQVRSFYPSNMS
jgi:hypothetical protein